MSRIKKKLQELLWLSHQWTCEFAYWQGLSCQTDLQYYFFSKVSKRFLKRVTTPFIAYLRVLVKLVFVHWLHARIKGRRPSALIFHECNKNCILFIFIIRNRIQFKWKIIEVMKRGSFLQKSTLCLIMIWRKLDTVETNCIFFLLHTKIKNLQ